MKIISFNDLKDIVKSGDVISIAALSVANLPVNVGAAAARQASTIPESLPCV